MLTTEAASHCDTNDHFQALNKVTAELKAHYDNLCDVYDQECLLQTLMIEKLAAIRVRHMEMYHTSQSSDEKKCYVAENALRYRQLYPMRSSSAVNLRLEREWNDLPMHKQEEWAVRVKNNNERKRQMDNMDRGLLREEIHNNSDSAMKQTSSNIKRKQAKALEGDDMKRAIKKSKLSDACKDDGKIGQPAGVRRSSTAEPQHCESSDIVQEIAQGKEKSVTSYQKDEANRSSNQDLEIAAEEKDDDDDDLDDDSLSSAGGSASDDESDDPMAQLPIGAFG